MYENAFDLPDAYREPPVDEQAWNALQAAGAGVADPFGMTSWAAGKAGFPNAAARLQEMRGLHPKAATAASAWTATMVPFGALSLPGNIAAFGAAQGVPIWGRELGQLGMVLAPSAAGTATFGLDELLKRAGLDNMRLPFRAQGRYPIGGF